MHELGQLSVERGVELPNVVGLLPLQDLEEVGQVSPNLHDFPASVLPLHRVPQVLPPSLDAPVATVG